MSPWHCPSPVSQLQPQSHEPAPSWHWEMPSGRVGKVGTASNKSTVQQNNLKDSQNHHIPSSFSSHSFQNSHLRSLQGFSLSSDRAAAVCKPWGVFPSSMAPPLPPPKTAPREPWNTQEKELPTSLTQKPLSELRQCPSATITVTTRAVTVLSHTSLGMNTGVSLCLSSCLNSLCDITEKGFLSPESQ